jgi:formate dehydrogenase alpha subunit
MTCEKSGDCRLEKYAYDYGVKDTRFTGKRREFEILAENPFIVRDYTKCINCGLCVRVCRDVQVNNVVEFANKGFEARVTTPFERGMEDSNCVFCGQCVALCPTGALVEKSRLGRGREWEFRQVTTTCPYCGCGCGLVLHIKDDRIVKVTGDESNPASQGWLCIKGKFGLDFVEHKDRLRKPLIKKNGEFVEATWEEALSLVAAKLKEFKDKYGSDSVGGLSSAKCTNEENFLFQKFMRAVMGTNNVDHCARLCHAPSVVGLGKAFGSGAMTNSVAEIENCEVLLVTGSNTTETHPVIALRMKKAVSRGAKLILVDPRNIELADFAAIHLRQKSGTDVAWLNGMANVIIAENLWDKDFVEGRCENFEEFKKSVEKYTPELVEKISGIPANDLREAARTFAKAEKGSIFYSMGITQHTTGSDNVLAVANLAMLTGNVGKESTGVNPLRGQNNVQGACDMGALSNVCSGYQKVADDEARSKFEKAWNVVIPNEPGLTVVEMLHAAKEGKVKAIYIMGENPMLSEPDTNKAEESLKALEFLVVQDIFLTETAKLADVVLPSASFAERDGTITNTERRVQMVRKAIEPIGESRADWEITTELARRLGYEMGYQSPQDIMKEIVALTPIYGGMTYEKLEKEGIQWPCPTPDHPGTKFLHKEKFTKGKGSFHPVEHIDPAELPDDEYPLVLTTGRVLYHYHTIVSRKSKGLMAIYPEGLVEVNPEDAEGLSIKDGEMVTVSSRRGSARATTCVTGKVPKGTVFMTFHFPEACANILTNPALDPQAKIPEYKVCAVKIEKMKG